MSSTTQDAAADGSLRPIAEDPQPLGAPSNPQHDHNLPVPMSPSYHYPPLRHPQQCEKTCSHSTMAKIYQPGSKCNKCHRRGHFGWLYRCTVERDALILDAKTKGFSVAFDEIGYHFAEHMTLGKLGPDVRSKENNLFKEILESPGKACSYTRQQLAVWFAQRDHVRKTIANERNHPSHSSSYARQKFPDDSKPWMPDKAYECRQTICHRCHSIGRDKSMLSINSILEGDILPSVAVGFSFNHMGFRPCVDANVVKNLGCRAVPLPRNHPARAGSHATGKLPILNASGAGMAAFTVIPTAKGVRSPISNGLNLPPLAVNALITKPTDSEASMAPRSLSGQSVETGALELPLDVEVLDDSVSSCSTA